MNEGRTNMAHYASKYVECPFYRSNDNNRIKCEGLSEGNAIHLVFQDSKDKTAYMRERCYSVEKCKQCVIHNVLYDKWEAEDE
jgi:hypothetical protein